MAEDDSLEPPEKRRRLGQRKRVALNQVDPSAKGASELARFLVEQWAWGHISPQMVQQVASKACSDMKQDPPLPLQQLASLGGGYSNKMSADMIAIQKSQLPSPFTILLPYQKQARMQKMLLPHEIFASIFANYRHVFDNVLVGPAGQLAEFWRCSRYHPALALHPMLGDTSHVIPLALHGDGVPIVGKGKIWCKTAWVYSWCSLLSQGPTKDKQFYIGMVWDTLQSPTTMDTFLSVVAWSLKYLQLGVWPMEKWDGQQPLGLFCMYAFCWLLTPQDCIFPPRLKKTHTH